MKGKIWGPVGVLAAALIGAVIYAESTQGIPVKTAKVHTGPIRTYVEDRAQTTLPRVYRITMPLTGRILPIQFDKGARVHKGQIVARLDTADLETAVAVAKSRLAEVQAQVVLIQNNDLENTVLEESRSFIAAAADTVRASEEQVRVAAEELKFAESWLQAKRALAGDVAKLELKAAERDYLKAKLELATDRFLSSSVKAIREAVNLGPDAIRQWINLKTLYIKVLEEQILGAKEDLDKANRDLKRVEIPSPIDGVVLERYVENERLLPADARLLDIGDLERLEVTAELLSEDAAVIKKGDAVDITGAAVGSDPVSGRVVRIDPQGLTKLSSLGVEEQRVKVIIRFEDQALESLKNKGRNLGSAYRVRVRVYTAEKGQAVLAPRTALFRGDKNAWQVFVIRDGRARLVTVRLGLANDLVAEILEGLKSDDLVVIAPPNSLKDGSRVETES